MKFAHNSTPPAGHYRGSVVLVAAVLAALISSGVAFSLAKLHTSTMKTLETSKVNIEAQQYGLAKAELLRSTSYDDVISQNKTSVKNSNGFTDEVVVGAEIDYSDTVKQKVCTINVYKDGEMLPRFSYKLSKLITDKGSSNGVPAGTILPWYGDKANIPNGFALCNGQNGTPDLRDRFLVGAGSAYKVSDVGGISAVSILKENLPSDGLSAFGYSCVGHYCTYGQGNFGKRKGEYVANPSKDGSNGWQDYFYFTAFSSILSNNWKGTSLENRPPYYAVFYIMKL